MLDEVQFVVVKSTDLHSIELTRIELGQVVDGLNERAQAWERTALYHRTGLEHGQGVVEECTDADEAEWIARFYRSIIDKIEDQIAEQ